MQLTILVIIAPALEIMGSDIWVVLLGLCALLGTSAGALGSSNQRERR